MALILCLETALDFCSVALGRDGTLISFAESSEERSHARVITSLASECLREASVSFSDLSAVAISAGPGSYTGLRIGAACAKGLCFAYDLPLIAVNTLEAMSIGFMEQKLLSPSRSLVVPMIDARRMEVYTAVYSAGLEQIKASHALVLNESSFSEFSDKQLNFFGNGALKFSKLAGSHLNYTFTNDYRQTARALLIPGFEKFNKAAFETISSFEPYYLKEFYQAPKNQ